MHKVTRALLSIVLTSPPITTQAKVLKTIKINDFSYFYDTCQRKNYNVDGVVKHLHSVMDHQVSLVDFLVGYLSL